MNGVCLSGIRDSEREDQARRFLLDQRLDNRKSDHVVLFFFKIFQKKKKKKKKKNLTIFSWLVSGPKTSENEKVSSVSPFLNASINGCEIFFFFEFFFEIPHQHSTWEPEF